MELGELLDEKGRFKRISMDEEHIYGRPPKHVVFDESLTSTPSPKNMRYMNGNDPHTYVIDNRGIPTPPFPLESPKSNKCVRRCRNAIREAWVVVLMLYVLIIPVVMYQLNVKVRYVNKQVNDMRRSISKPAPAPAPKKTKAKAPTISSIPKPAALRDERTKGVSTVYTRWGKISCSNKSDVSLVYSGYVGGSHYTHTGGGANYLCLPRKASYLKYDQKDNRQGKLYGVNIQLTETSLFDVEDARDLQLVYCAVCTVTMRSVTLMIPAAMYCPKGWNKEYNGYLMAQKYYMKRTEFICVDSQLDVNISDKTMGKTGGYVGGSYHTGGGAVNYLCLPFQPSYGKFDQVNNRSGKIDGVEFEVNESVSTAPNAYCAVCKVIKRVALLMIPMRTECPDGWIKEYNGYIMSQMSYNMRRTEYTCVDENPYLKNETGKWEKGGFLHFVGMNSKVGSEQTVYQNKLNCVVCTV